jgi:release factor glutamine methyltransferase
MAKSVEGGNQLDHSGSPLQQRSQRLLDQAVHFLSYQFILSRRRTTVARAAGLRLTVPPTVFHPRYFLTSEFFAAFITGLDLAGKRVADVGTGTGILALAAARAGAASVLAIDINPNAARAAAKNAAAKGLERRVKAVCADIFSGVSTGRIFSSYQIRPSLPGSRSISPTGRGMRVRTTATLHHSRPMPISICSS